MTIMTGAFEGSEDNKDEQGGFFLALNVHSFRARLFVFNSFMSDKREILSIWKHRRGGKG